MQPYFAPQEVEKLAADNRRDPPPAGQNERASQKVVDLPAFGGDQTEAEIIHWKVRTGDVVAVNDIICEVETAKAVVELPSPYAGTVVAILVSEGTKIPVGWPIIAIDVALPADTVDGREQSDTGAREKTRENPFLGVAEQLRQAQAAGAVRAETLEQEREGTQVDDAKHGGELSSEDFSGEDTQFVPLNVRINRETAQALESLARERSISISEAVRRAIGFYKFIHDEDLAGRKVQTMDSSNKNNREIVIM